MQQCVVGVFDEAHQARQASDALAAAGFSRANIKIIPGEANEQAREEVMHTEDTDSGLHLGRLFHSLFGADDTDQRDLYQEAVQRGCHLVHAQTGSGHETLRAAEVINQFGPVDIEERCEKWREDGWAGEGDAGLYSARRIAAARGYTATDAPNNEVFRSHWQSTCSQAGGQYEEYESAYRYGADLSGVEIYRSMTWNDLEPEARREWEERNPDTPWERAREAVRYGWEKLTGRT